ncbi:hypothetical protein D3C80_1709860 [compost metagenome]
MTSVTFHASTCANIIALVFAVLFISVAAWAVLHAVWVVAAMFVAFATWIAMFVFTTRIDVSDNAVCFSRYFVRRFTVPLRGANISQTRTGDLQIEPALRISNSGVEGLVPLGLLRSSDCTRLRALVESRVSP